MNNNEMKKLLNSYYNGNSESFVKLYSDMKIPVFTIAYRIVLSREDAEDITQEVFVRMLSSPDISSVSNPRAWLFQVAHNLSIDTLRKRKDVLSDTEENVLSSDEDTTPETVDSRIDTESAFSRLELKERQVVALHLYGDMTFEEISGIMQMSLPSTYRLYRKSINKIKKFLNGG